MVNVPHKNVSNVGVADFDRVAYKSLPGGTYL